jgi:hypothetical protein
MQAEETRDLEDWTGGSPVLHLNSSKCLVFIEKEGKTKEGSLMVSDPEFVRQDAALLAQMFCYILATVFSSNFELPH